MNTNCMSRRQMVALSAAGFGLCVLGGAAVGAWAEEETTGAEREAAVGVVEDGWVLDMKGDRAVEAGTVSTVLTVNSVATEMVLMLGGEDAAATLGQGFEYSEGSLNRAMYPGLEGKKTFTRDDCTVENVAAIGPDLVICDVADTVEALRNAGINCAFASVTSPATIVQAVDILGAAMGDAALQKAESYHEAYDQAIEEVSAAADIPEDERARVLYLRGIDSACGANSMPNNWISMAGGIDVVAEDLGLEGSRVEINIESIMACDPDVIVCESPTTYADVTGSDALAALQAVETGAVYTAPLGPVVWSMGSTEALLQLYWAANVISPQACDFDLETIIRGYFETFYDYEVSSQEIEEILNR